MNVLLDIDQYQSKWESKLENVLKIIEDNGWVLKSQNSEISFYMRNDASSNFSQVKSIVSIPCTMEDVEKALRNIPTIKKGTPKDQNDGFIERIMLQQIENDPDACFYYIAVESPSVMVTPRDFLLYQRITHVEGKLILLRTSIENHQLKPIVKGLVRGNMFFQAYIAEPDPLDVNCVRLTFIVHADPCGSIPSMIYNSVVIRQGDSVLKIKKQILEQ